MKAMILAAGLGERMRPLTDETPKPLLKVAGRPLIDYHLCRLQAAGVTQVVINVCHLAQQIEAYCGTGERWALDIQYSREASPLETAGGIAQALPLLLGSASEGEADFILLNGDVWTDYPLEQLLGATLSEGEDARLVMVDNPEQHPLGDFYLDESGRLRVLEEGVMGCTYAGLAVFNTALFRRLIPGKLALRPIFDAAIAAGSLGGERYRGRWFDIGTPQRLAALDTLLRGTAQ